MTHPLLPGLVLILSTLLPLHAVWAEPWQPKDERAVVETLTTQSSARKEERRLRLALQRSPEDLALALAAARTYLDQARTQGDARFAGLALGTLSAWASAVDAPTEVLVMRATIAQYLHDFDGAANLLQAALARDPRHAQAWLTLATVRRVQASFAASDEACQHLAALGQALHARACLAENQSIQGRHDVARATLQALLTGLNSQAGPAVKQWLQTTLAEVEERAGRPAAAEAAWKQAWSLGPHPYVQTGYADFLLQQNRSQEVIAWLAKAPLTDGVLLRLAIAGHRVQARQAPAWALDMQARLAASAARPDSGQVHAREQARFALEVLGQPERAVSLARLNLKFQRESADFMVLAQALSAMPDGKAASEGRSQLQQMIKSLGVQDARLVL